MNSKSAVHFLYIVDGRVRGVLRVLSIPHHQGHNQNNERKIFKQKKCAIFRSIRFSVFVFRTKKRFLKVITGMQFLQIKFFFKVFLRFQTKSVVILNILERKLIVLCYL